MGIGDSCEAANAVRFKRMCIRPAPQQPGSNIGKNTTTYPFLLSFNALVLILDSAATYIYNSYWC